MKLASNEFDCAPGFPETESRLFLPEQHPQIAEGVSMSIRREILRGKASLVSEIYQIGESSLFVDANGNQTDRVDRYLRVVIDGYGIGMRETLPSNPLNRGPNILHLPGFIEKIEVGSAHNNHDGWATEFPDSRVVSVASDGIGNIGEKLSLGNFRDHDMRGMGEERAKLAEALFGDEWTIVSALSMGTVIRRYMEDYDMTHGRNLNTYSSDFAIAVLTPEKAALIMLGIFPIAMVSDTGREALRMGIKYGVNELLSLASMVQERGDDALAFLGQVASLKSGMSLKLLQAIAHERKGGLIIHGAIDPLKHSKLHGRMKEIDPSIHIVSIARKGHAIAADGLGAAIKSSHTLQRYKIVEDGQRAA